MKLSELIREYVDLKIVGEPKTSDWSSIDYESKRRAAYYETLDDLEKAIDDAVMNAAKATGEQA